MDTTFDLVQVLNGIRGALDTEIDALIQSGFVPHSRLPVLSFFLALSRQDRYWAFKMCILMYIISEQAIVPRELQLLAALAEMNELDMEVHSGTGSGKNLITALPIILDPVRRTIVIVPTKCLQITQVQLIRRTLRSWTHPRSKWTGHRV